MLRLPLIRFFFCFFVLFCNKGDELYKDELWEWYSIFDLCVLHTLVLGLLLERYDETNLQGGAAYGKEYLSKSISPLNTYPSVFWGNRTALKEVFEAVCFYWTGVRLPMLKALTRTDEKYSQLLLAAQLKLERCIRLDMQIQQARTTVRWVCKQRFGSESCVMIVARTIILCGAPFS